MQNQQFLIEELARLNQLRQQQQQDLLQAQQQLQLPQSLTGAAVAAKYPLSSALLGSLASLGGAPAVPPPVPVAPSPQANIAADALLLSQVQQQLQTGGALQQLAALGATPSPAPAMAAAPGVILGNSLSATLMSALTAPPANSMTNEEILSKLAATGLLGTNIPNLLNQAQPAAVAPPPPPAAAPPAAGVSLPSLLTSLAANLDRKREATATPSNAVAPVPPAFKKQKVAPSPSPAASIDVLAAAVELQTRQRSMAIVADRTLGNSFPLPPAATNDNGNTKPRSGIMGMPKLTSFRKAWDSVKTKGMQKEIFLRKLHSGKMVQPRLSSKESGQGNSHTV